MAKTDWQFLSASYFQCPTTITRTTITASSAAPTGSAYIIDNSSSYNFSSILTSSGFDAQYNCEAFYENKMLLINSGNLPNNKAISLRARLRLENSFYSYIPEFQDGLTFIGYTDSSNTTDWNLMNTWVPEYKILRNGSIATYAPTSPNSYRMWHINGYFYAPVSGSYTFRTRADYTAYYWIGKTAEKYYPTTGEAFMQSIATSPVTASVSLDEGYHYFKVLWQCDGDPNNMSIGTEGPSMPLSYDTTGRFFSTDYKDYKTEIGIGAKFIEMPKSYINSSIASARPFTFGTNDFTVEVWAYPVRRAENRSWISILAVGDSSTNELRIGQNVNNAGWGFRLNNTTFQSNNTLPLDRWNHIALTRQSGVTRMYVNGTASVSTSTVYNLQYTGDLRIGYGFTSNDQFVGHINNIRITKGVARYTGTSNFVPPTGSFNDEQDPYWENVELLLEANNISGSTQQVLKDVKNNRDVYLYGKTANIAVQTQDAGPGNARAMNGLFLTSSYVGYWNGNTSFFNTATKYSGTARYVADFKWPDNQINDYMDGGSPTNYSVVYEGYFIPTTTGIWKFRVGTTAASTNYFGMWIGPEAESGYTSGNAVIFGSYNANYLYGSKYFEESQAYKVKIFYGNQNWNGAASMYLYCTPPNTSVERTDFTGLFYSFPKELNSPVANSSSILVNSIYPRSGDYITIKNTDNQLYGYNDGYSLGLISYLDKTPQGERSKQTKLVIKTTPASNTKVSDVFQEKILVVCDGTYAENEFHSVRFDIIPQTDNTKLLKAYISADASDFSWNLIGSASVIDYTTEQNLGNIGVIYSNAVVKKIWNNHPLYSTGSVDNFRINVTDILIK